ncbi:MAG TPA: hypothetical protein VGO03_01830 [Acidimicrobiia bacterium]
MAERLRLIAFGALLGVLWGVVAAWWYGAPIAHGIIIGVALWGPAAFVAIPGPHAPVVENVES